MSTLPSLVTKVEAQPPDTQPCKTQPSQSLSGGDVLSVEQVLPTCLCSGEQVCDKCLHPTQMAAVVCSVRKENQALKLHIVALKERVKALENHVLALKDNKQNHATRPRGHSKPKAANQLFTDLTNNARSQPKPSSYTGTRVFRCKSYAQAASVEGNGKARCSRGNTHSQSSLARQHDRQAGHNVGNEASF